ncbi:MAG: GSCFA domain-containing protein [Salibacteraceae bacterium]
MDQFRTQLPFSAFPFQIDHTQRLFLIGSCFTENIGERLKANKFVVNLNPFGILFNPFSIVVAFERMLSQRTYTADDLLQAGEYWVSLDHHSRFSRRNRQESVEAINSSLRNGSETLRQAAVIFITLGTSWVYRHNNTGHIVANCHKLPASEFSKELLSAQDVHLTLRHIPQMLRANGLNPQVVFTVSPVRHLKDGFVENQRSKAQLISAVHAVVDEFENCHYFPAYELLMDDLRDYRFYASDMVHPSTQAVDYVWDHFKAAFFSDETRIICDEVRSVVQAAQHKPIDPESNSFQRFARKQLSLIQGLNKKYPMLDLSAEKHHFESLLL